MKKRAIVIIATLIAAPGVYALALGQSWTFVLHGCSAVLLLVTRWFFLWGYRGKMIVGRILSMIVAAGTMAAAALLLLLALLFGIYNPDLTPDKAAALVGSNREFKRIGTVTAVSHLTRFDSSGCSADDCYGGTISFSVNEAPETAANGDAVFIYKRRRWRLESFSYGEKPGRHHIDVEQE
jgi:hypothetical protein